MSETKAQAAETKSITRLARVIRSKNASPFMSTIDFFFDDDERYRLVRDSGVITAERISAMLRIPAADVMGIHFHDVARGIKISIIKPGHVASGDPDCADLFGAQQYVPLLALEIPIS